ncbi:MAG: polysaccharide pyruvyl transferase CsaB [Dethiobacter sp.]|nr:polysaccharide pyruvyl transferase CsaB [Dethiobacter sp.]
MMHLVISGYYGFGNAGDEAILYSILTSLRDAAQEVGEELRFTVLSADPAVTAARFNVQAVGRTDLRRIIGALRRADAFVSGGGGLLQDVTGRNLSVSYYLGLVVLARLLGKPALLYAQGIGPVTKPFNRLLVRLFANCASLVSVRDEESRRELGRLAVTRPPLVVTVDPVFALQAAKDSPAVTSFRDKLLPDRPVMAVSVRPWPAGNNYLREIASATDCLVQELAAQVVLLPLYPAKDLPACRELANLLQSPAIILEDDLSAPELLAVFAHFDLLLAMRLHALIFAAKTGLPMVGIGYDPKVDALLSLLGRQTAGKPEDLSAAGLCAAALAEWAERAETRRFLLERSTGFAAEARRFAKEIYAFVREGAARP